MNIKKGYIVSGHGPIIVLLHSSMSSKDQWKHLTHLLNPKFKIIAIDLAGYGDNELPANPQTFSTDDEVNIVENILKKETRHHEMIHLVGHSYGGAIALKLTIKILKKVKTLTLFEPVAFHLLGLNTIARNEISTIVQKLTKAVGKKDPEYATKVFIDYWSGKGTFENLALKTQNAFVRYIDKVLLDFAALFKELLTLKDYSKITVPVCMIKGELSPLASLQVFSTLEQYIPNRSIHCVPGGHMSPITHFNKVNQIIENFLAAGS